MDRFDDLHHDPEREHQVTAHPDIEEPAEIVETLTVAGSLGGATLRALFSNRNFIPLWLGQLVSYIGDQFFLIAVVAMITSIGGSSNVGPLILFAVSLAAPQILFGLISGVLVDKQDRKRVMIASDVVRALAMFALLGISGNPDRLWILYLAALAIGSAQMLFYPARASALTAIVTKHDLAGANALLEVGFVVALIFGSGAAGILVEKFGANTAFAFNGIAFLFSSLMIALIRIPKVRATSPTGSTTFREVWLELRQGLSYVWHTRSMRYIMGLSLIVSGGLGAVVILVLDYLDKTLNIGASGFGAVIAILGVGIVIGGVLIQRLSKYLPTNRLVAVAMALQGLAVGIFIFQPTFAVVLICTALIGFSLIVARAVLSTLTQAIPPEEYRGRVQSTFNLISQAPLAAAIGLVGVLVSIFSRTAVVAGFSILMFVMALVTVRTLRGIDEAIYNDSDAE